MIEVPDRITPLIQRLEAGDPPTQCEVDQVAVLQALDLAKMNDAWVKEQILQEQQHNELLAQI